MLFPILFNQICNNSRILPILPFLFQLCGSRGKQDSRILPFLFQIKFVTIPEYYHFYESVESVLNSNSNLSNIRFTYFCFYKVSKCSSEYPKIRILFNQICNNSRILPFLRICWICFKFKFQSVPSRKNENFRTFKSFQY